MNPEEARDLPQGDSPDPEVHAQNVDALADYLLADGRTDDLLTARAQSERDVTHTERVAARAKELMARNPALRVGEAVRQAHEESQASAPVLAAPITPATARAQARCLLALVPGLRRREALRLAFEDAPRFAPSGQPRPMWEREEPTARSVRRAAALVLARRLWRRREALAAIYERVCGELAATGIPFELLAAWHRGERAE